MATPPINKTFSKPLPQDGILSCRVSCAPGASAVRAVSLERFYSLDSRRLYVSARGAGLDGSGAILLSIRAGGREILPPTDIRMFTPNYSKGAGMRLCDIGNFRHCFCESSTVEFTAENKTGHDATLFISIIGQRFFSGSGRNDFVFESEPVSVVPGSESAKIEYDWVPKPASFRFVSHLGGRFFRFDFCDDPASGEQAAYPLGRFCRYRLSEISVHSSLPAGLFAGAVSERFRFNLRTSRKHSFMASPFGFSSHIHRCEIDSYMQDAHSDEACDLIGNLYGSLLQTKELIRLGSEKVAIVVNCMIYEGGEHGRQV